MLLAVIIVVFVVVVFISPNVCENFQMDSVARFLAHFEWKSPNEAQKKKNKTSSSTNEIHYFQFGFEWAFVVLMEFAFFSWRNYIIL